jgi:hypothetical protein
VGTACRAPTRRQLGRNELRPYIELGKRRKAMAGMVRNAS